MHASLVCNLAYLKLTEKYAQLNALQGHYRLFLLIQTWETTRMGASLRQKCWDGTRHLEEVEIRLKMPQTRVFYIYY